MIRVLMKELPVINLLFYKFFVFENEYLSPMAIS